MAPPSGDPFYAGPACPRCDRPVAIETLTGGLTRCSVCGQEYEATRFDPPGRLERVARVEEAGPVGATACARHPGNAAVAHCERCGILMCGLCRIDADRMALCPACFERLSDEGALSSTCVSFHDHARVALTLALIGLLLGFTGFMTGPIAIYYGIRAYSFMRATNETEGIWRIWIAFVLGLAQIALSLWLLWMVFMLS
jgi:hypothetical protein